MLQLLSVIFACSSSEKDSSNEPITDSFVPTETDQGWSVGAVEPCGNSSVIPSYQDISFDFGDPNQSSTFSNTEGAIAIREYKDQWWIWEIISNTVTARNRLGEEVQYESTTIPIRIYLLDIDQNGEDDLFILGESLDLIWSIQTPNERREALIPNESFRGVRDLALIDLEGDGDLDLWVLAGTSDETSIETWSWIFEQESTGVLAEPYEYIDREYFGAAFDGVVFDWEGDGDPDIYICNDFGFFYGANSLLQNDQGLLTEGDPNGSDINTACMGASVGDLNSDGHLDIYLTATQDHHLIQGSENGFIDVSSSVGLPVPEQPQMLWGSQILDYNNDGLWDILAASSGFTMVSSTGVEIAPYPLWLMEQTAIDQFQEVGAQFGFPQESTTRAVLAHDINSDGVLDIFATSADHSANIWLSEGCTANNWVTITAPDNSIVTVVAGDKRQKIHLTKTPGFAASMPSTAHIGLGETETIDWIEVSIPWVGNKYILGPLEARRRLVFTPSAITE
jgi:hypothetical protein